MNQNPASLPLSRGNTIGILGGGQLGRMLALAAARLDLQTLIFEPSANCPAAQLANRHISAPFDDMSALAEFRDACDVVTYEFENIPLETAQFLEQANKLRPGSKALENSQDRLVEKHFLNGLGVSTAPFVDVSSVDDLVGAVATLGTDGILKTRNMGYDGKGQVRITNSASRDQLADALSSTGSNRCILEGFVAFEREISIIVARDVNGKVVCFDPAENLHREGILRTSTVPAKISPQTTTIAMETAAKIVSALEYVGVMGVEFFVIPGGTLLVNEIAPRVHNSGHWTEAACTVSQFEQHIRAISGWPLANPSRHSNCVMENLIGADMDKVPALMDQPNTLLHLYGKADIRAGRKMGHFTRLIS